MYKNRKTIYEKRFFEIIKWLGRKSREQKNETNLMKIKK